jgi:F-type H+-transporting ATPase subunit delta
MISGSLARRYARALLDIGVDDGNYERIGREVSSLAEAIRMSRELNEVLTSPAIARSDRERVLLAILSRLGASATVTNFARLLLARERIVALRDVARELEAMIDEKVGRVKATLTSAAPLSAEQAERLVSILERLSGKRVEVETREDQTLLGGSIARVGDVIYDGSLRTQLQRLRQSLTK